jgi:hypothetical protein
MAGFGFRVVLKCWKWGNVIYSIYEINGCERRNLLKKSGKKVSGG